MEDNSFIEKLAATLAQNGSVKNVFGEPIVSQDKTIIPVAQVALGFGGGFGQKNPRHKNAQPAEGEGTAGGGSGERGAGGGGGLRIRPAGVYEVSARSTKFIPASNTRLLLLAALGGFILRGWLGGRRK